jgi:outer membrane receptor protein involved in Fe transport
LTQDEEEIVQMDPWQVTGTVARGYGATASMGGSRINLPLVDIPLPVITVTRELMNDVSAVDSYHALRFVSGMGPASTVTINSMTLRGLETRGNSFNILDGLPGGGIEQETEFIERYEVVKGAAGTLYGDHSLGGLINRVYKQPLRNRRTTAQAFYSDIGDTWQASIDQTGPIDRERQLTYRVVGVYRDGETKNGGADSKEAVYGTIQYIPRSTRARVWGRAEWRNVETGHETPSAIVDGAGQSSLPSFGPELRTVPIANDEERVFKYFEFGVTTAMSGLLGDWDFRFVARLFENRNLGENPAIIPIGYTFLDAAGNVLGKIATAAGPGQATFSMPWSDIRLTNHVSRISGPDKSETRGFFVDLTGSFNTGPLAHRMIAYVQSTNEKSRSYFTNLTLRDEFGGSESTGNLNMAQAYSLVHPRTLPNDMSLFRDPMLATNSASSGERFNFGIQDNVYLWNNRILLVAGARYDYIQNNASYNYLTNVGGRPETTTSWVYKAAGVVKPFPGQQGISLFLNYAETFEPRFGELISGSGIPFKNLEGVSKEAGIKMELMDSRLIATGSYFDNELTNNPIRIFNPATGLDEFVQSGVSPIKGWEVDFSWVINKNWTTLLGLSDVDAKASDGRRLRNVQNEFNYKALLKYTVTHPRFSGLSAGAAVISIGDRAGDNPNSYITPGYETLDLFAYYAWKNWRFQANVFNVTDKEALASSIFQSLVLANDPRNFRFSLQYRF